MVCVYTCRPHSWKSILLQIFPFFYFWIYFCTCCCFEFNCTTYVVFFFSLSVPRAEVSFSVENLSVSVVGVVVNFSHFHLQSWEPISTKLDTKHPLIKWIQVCSNEWPGPIPRGDNYKKAKILKSSSPESLGQFQLNFAQKILSWWGLRFVQMKGLTLFQGEIKTKIRNYINEIFISRTNGTISIKIIQGIRGW